METLFISFLNDDTFLGTCFVGWEVELSWAELGREPKDCTQVRAALMQHIFTQVKVKSGHSKNDSNVTKKMYLIKRLFKY